MDKTQTIERETTFDPFANNTSEDEPTEARLNSLLAANAEYSRENDRFGSAEEEFEASLLENPISNDKAFALFGLFMGAFPPFAFLAQIFFNANDFRVEDSWVVVLLLVVNVVTAIAGYFSGKIVGKVVGELEKVNWLLMLLALPFIGSLWGMVSGAAGGLIFFGIGAVFGGMIGGMAGTVALPVFAVLHRIFKKGDVIDKKILLPLALGVSIGIAAFIAGLS